MSATPAAASQIDPFSAKPAPRLTLVIYASLVIVGLTLAIAAFFKLTQGVGVMDRVIAALELGFIAWLVVFRTRWWAWATSAALFAAFAGYAGFLVYRGESSCGCFGAVEVPPIRTMMLDIGLALLSVSLALMLARSLALIGALATVMGFSAAIGVGYSVLSADPLPSDFHGDRIAMLSASPELADVAGADLSAPDYLIYIYNPRGGDDQPMLAVMLDDAQEHPDDDTLQVRVYTTDEVEAMSDVPGWAWERLPQAMLFRAGEVVRRYMGDNFIEPAALRAERPRGAIAEVLALDEYEHIAMTTDELPVYMLYVYNQDCPICIQHLSHFDDFITYHNDEGVVTVVPISMQDLENDHDIPLWSWPGVPTTYIVRAGRVIAQRAGPTNIPTPYQLRQDLLDGRELLLPPTVPPDDIDHSGHDH